MTTKVNRTAHALPHGESLVQFLLARPPDARAKMLVDLITANGAPFPALQAVVTQLFQKLDNRNPNAEAAELKACYEHALAELAEGPARPATFIAEADGDMPGPKPRVHVVSPASR
jgi:hypothetical protein